MTNKYKFEYTDTVIKYSLRDKLELSNNDYIVVHALGFVHISSVEDIDMMKQTRTNYKPDLKQLSEDIGISGSTIKRCIKTLRTKELVHPKYYESTTKWYNLINTKQRKNSLYDIIQHGPRQHMGLTTTQYLVAAVYTRLCGDREWATLDKKKIAKTIGISLQYVHDTIKVLEKKGLMKTKLRKIEHNRDFLDVKMTQKWLVDENVRGQKFKVK